MSEMMQWVKYSNSLGFTISGRARRREFWWNYLFYTLVSLVIAMFMMIITAIGTWLDVTLLIWLGYSASTLLNIGVAIKIYPIMIRRFHDTGKSGWMILLCILLSACCGIGGIMMLVFTVMDSTPGDNQYGPNPKGIGGMNMNGMNMNGMNMNGMNMNGMNMNGMNMNGMNMNNQNWQ